MSLSGGLKIALGLAMSSWGCKSRQIPRKTCGQASLTRPLFPGGTPAAGSDGVTSSAFRRGAGHVGERDGEDRRLPGQNHVSACSLILLTEHTLRAVEKRVAWSELVFRAVPWMEHDAYGLCAAVSFRLVDLGRIESKNKPNFKNIALYLDSSIFE